MQQDLSLLAAISTQSEQISCFHLLHSYPCLFVLIFTIFHPTITGFISPNQKSL